MSEESNRKEEENKASRRPGGEAPEPPPSWRPSKTDYEQPYEQSSKTPQGNDEEPPQAPRLESPTVRLTSNDELLLENARKFISISQICAVVSFFLGGILLSSVAVILAVMGLVKLNTFANAHSLERGNRAALMRSGVIALGMCVLALVFNIVSIVMFYPIIMQGLETGDFSGIFGSGQGSSTASDSTSSTWG